MIVAFDTYYYDDFSYTVAGIFDNWKSAHTDELICSKRIGIDADYVPGRLYERELPCIMQCLKQIDVNKVDLIIVDGFVWLTDDDGRMKPVLGEMLHRAILETYGKEIEVIGIAKNPPHNKTGVEVRRGDSNKPLWVTCSNISRTDGVAELVRLMEGEFRIPNILKEVDQETRKYRKIG